MIVKAAKQANKERRFSDNDKARYVKNDKTQEKYNI